MGDKKPKPPKLPDNAPQDLKDFVACKVMSVTLDPTKPDWLPKPPLAGAPTVTAEAKGADQIEVSVGFGDTAKIKLPISVEGGQLKADSSGVPDLFGMKAGVDNWVKKLNDAVKGNGKEFDHIEIKDGKIVVTKRGAAGANAAGAGGLKSTPAKVAMGVGAAVLIGVGVYAVANNGDSGSGTISPVAGAPTAAPPTEAPVDSAVGQPTATPEVVAGPTTSAPPAEVACTGFDPALAPAPGDEVWSEELEKACNPFTLPSDVGLSPGSMVELGYDPTVFITHQQSEPDFLTGLVGPSFASFKFQISGGYEGSLMVQSDCSGQLLTGQAPLVPDGPTIVSHPLFQYGPCTVTHVDLDIEDIFGGPIPILGSFGTFVYEVGPTETPVDPSAIPQVFGGVPPNASWVVLSTLSNIWLPPECALVLGPNAIDLSTVQCFGAPIGFQYVTHPGSDGLLAWGAAHVEPPEGTPPDWSTPLFGQTIFPCGPGQVGMTVCREGALDLVPPSFTVVSLVLAEPMPVVPDASTAAEPITIDFSSSGGPAYRLVAAGDHWSLVSGVETDARAIIRNDSVTFVFPEGELPAADATYVVSLAAADGSVVQSTVAPVNGRLPARPPTTASTTTTTVVTETTGQAETTTTVDPSTVTTSAPVETPESFFQMVSASIASGDPDFAMERLHPAVISTYSERECRANLEARAAPGYAITVVSVGATGPWTYAPPNKPPTEIPDALSLMVTIPGGTAPVEAHLAVVDGTYRWFTVCA